MGCVLLFAVPTLAIAFINGVPLLYPLRFIGGLGLGGCMPNATALLAELTPARNRGRGHRRHRRHPAGRHAGGFVAAQVAAENCLSSTFSAA